MPFLRLLLELRHSAMRCVQMGRRSRSCATSAASVNFQSNDVARSGGGGGDDVRRPRTDGPLGRIDFTKNNFKIARGPFHTLDEEHISFFRSILAPNQLIMDLSELEPYNVDWMKHLRGNSKLALRPKTTEEISKILTYCNKNKLAVCPQAGNTSIVGGSVPILDEIVLSTSSMNRIITIEPTSGALVCEAGCILENLNIALREHDLMMPIDLGARGSCQIGGNIATNAGGLRLFRYGNLHSNLLGLEVVMADGTILDLMSTLKKDNTGYHLKNLFVGSEGTLGVITKVAIQCPVRPPAVNVLFVGAQSFARILDTFQQAKRHLGEILSSVEVMDAASLSFTHEMIGVPSPIGEYPFYLLIETSGSNAEHDQEKLSAFLELLLEKHLVLNGTLATDARRVRELLSIRERIPETFNMHVFVFCYDFTMPLMAFYQLVEETRAHFEGRVKVVFGLGHIADGNLHLQIAIDEYCKELHEEIEAWLIGRVIALNGSISAEHGIGFLKSQYMKDVKTPNTLLQMQELKRLMDPNGILNPYKTIYVPR